MIIGNPYKNSLYFAMLFAAIIVSCKKESVFLKKEKPEVIISKERLTAETIKFVNDTVYLIADNLVRNAGQALLIEAGTLIKVKNYIGITINANGKIMAAGTANEPIVFTSDALKGAAGTRTPGAENAWRGIVINGAPAFSSGSLSYVRIEFAGVTGTDAGALSLRNVDKSTVLNNIQVSYSHSNSAPSFEFINGNCNATNLISYASVATDFSIGGGYTGKLQSLIAHRHPFFGSSSGVLIKGSNTFPGISNFTVIGPSGSYGLVVTDGAKFHIRNSVLSGFQGGFSIDSKESGISLQTGESDFSYSFVHSNDSAKAFYIPTGLIPGIIPPVTAADFKLFILQPQFHNNLILNIADFKFTDPYNYDVNPDIMPMPGSPVLSGANFDGPVFSDPFFKRVSYRGALGADNWLKGWTNFILLQTNYNN
jgi:hypothetical protein